MRYLTLYMILIRIIRKLTFNLKTKNTVFLLFYKKKLKTKDYFLNFFIEKN